MTTTAAHLARNTAAFIAVLALAAPAIGQPCPALSVANPDGNYIVPGVMGAIRYSRDLSLDAYVQRGAGRRPSVVVVHGGGWSSGSRAAHVGQILELLTAAGYNWFSIDYRLGGLARYDDSLADVRAALSFIRCRAGELGIDGNRLVLLGEDSGAQLAALLAAERPAGRDRRGARRRVLRSDGAATSPRASIQECWLERRRLRMSSNRCRRCSWCTAAPTVNRRSIERSGTARRSNVRTGAAG